MAAAQTCDLPGCHKIVHVDPRTGVAHNYCGRTHAKLALGDELQEPHGCCHECKLDGCEASVFFEADTGRVHDFCCNTHAELAISRGEWERPLKRLQGADRAHQCSLNGCAAPRYRDAETGAVHDYCGKSHALKAKQQGLLPAPLDDPTVDAKYQGNIGQGLAGNYDVSRLTPVHPKYANVVQQFETQWKHNTEKPTVVSVLKIRNTAEIYRAYEETLNCVGNQKRRWHGTSCAAGCNFAKDMNSGGARGKPCGNSACRLCNIAAAGFQLAQAGTGTGAARMNLRYGEGMYFSQTSSKSNDYNAGSETTFNQFQSGANKRRRGVTCTGTVKRRCMLLCKVALGRQFIAKDNGYVNGYDPVTLTPLGWSGAEIQEALSDHDSVHALPGTTPGINHDEEVVYDASQAIPSYVVVYDMP